MIVENNPEQEMNELIESKEARIRKISKSLEDVLLILRKNNTCDQVKIVKMLNALYEDFTPISRVEYREMSY